ncbi:MAG: hypothetical protein R6X18_04580 [Chloroflexota bacterium]|jgi:metal-responsive CopG/Arc/MetJ family transcriptional regulator
MTVIKAAVSIEKNLFQQAEEIAEELQVSRSHLFSLALENYVAHYHRQKTTRVLNEIYAGESAEEEEEQLVAMRRYQLRLLKDEPW